MNNEDTTAVPDSHLQNPIRPHNRSMFLKCSNPNAKIPDFIKSLYRNLPISNVYFNTDSEKLYGLFLQDCFDPNYKILNWVNQHLPAIWYTVSEHITKHYPDISGFNYSETWEYNPDLTKQVIQLFSLKQRWECVRITMQKLRTKESPFWVKVDDTPSRKIKNLYICQGYAIIQLSEDDDYWLFDYDQIMMICDTIVSRVFTILFMHLVPDDLSHKLPYNLLEKSYTAFDEIFHHWGNESYNCIKMWESLVQGVILKNHDPLRMAGKYIDSILEDVPELFKDTVQSLVQVLEDTSISKEQLCELFGINRHWGHPTVDEEAGCGKVQDIAHHRKLPCLKTMKRAKATFNRHFSIQFIHQYGRWPRIDLSDLNQKRPLYNVIINNVTTVNFYSAEFHLNDWEKITFSKEFEFDYKIDYTEMCSDKAISPYLIDIPCVYAPVLLGYKPTKPMSSRRILIELLKKEEIDIKKIFTTIQNREVPRNWKIVLLAAKEREHKIAPRLFAMLVLEMRLYYNITESNISKTIFKFFPQQTMTLNETELTKRVLTMANPDDVENFLPIYMSIDFKSWNIHWQYASTYDIFKCFDDLFGTPNLYTYSHIFFEQCMITISSRYNPPTSLMGHNNNTQTNGKLPEPCGLLWYNHSGGFEGIRQKGWTVITIILLLLVEMETGVKCFIIGQGDNQLLKLMLPIDKNISELQRDTYIITNQDKIEDELTRFLYILEKIASKFRLVIKKEESWFSSVYVNYGKDLLIRGAYMSQASKRISRTLPDVNDMYPTLFTKISSMQTTGLSTAQKTIEPLSSYMICQTETLMMVIRETICPLLPNMTYKSSQKEWATSATTHQFLLHASTSCHGVPISSLMDYMYRGHPDALSGYISMLYFGIKKCKWCTAILLYLQKKDFTIGLGKAELLINDPMSLNIDGPPLTSHIFKKQIFDKIQKITVNKDLREIFRESSKDEDNSLYNFLIGLRPLQPRLLHELLRQTVTATRLSIISRFSSARTVQGMLTKAELKKFYSKIIDSEQRLMSHWINICHKTQNYLGKHFATNLCPTLFTQDLRDYTWSIVTNGAKLEGITIPHPSHQFVFNSACSSDHSTCKGNKEFMMFKLVTINKTLVLYSRGPYQPYIGHRTQEKFSGKVFQVPNMSRPQKAAERLVQLFQWCLEDNIHMRNFITALINTRTNVPFNILELVTSVVTSGSPVHRLDDHVTSQGVLMIGRPNAPSHIYISTDTMGRFGKNSINFNMHFQGSILYAQECIKRFVLCKMNNENKDYNYIIFHLHFSCTMCEEKLHDIKVSNTTIPPKVVPYTRNPLIYADITKLPISDAPNVKLLKLVHHHDPNMAISFMLFSRILCNIDTVLWGTSQKNKNYSSKISIRVLSNMGLSDILDYLAILVYLYYDGDISSFRNLSGYLCNEIWRDFGPICIIPEILPELVKLSGNTYHANVFSSHAGYSRLLNKALSLKLRNIKQIFREKARNLVFYRVSSCGLSKIVKMWALLLFKLSFGLVNLVKVCKDVVFEDDAKSNCPNKYAFDLLEHTIVNTNNAYIMKWCYQILPLRLSRVGPELIAGQCVYPTNKIKEQSKAKLHTLRSTWYASTTFPTCVELACPERSVEALQEYIIDDSISPSIVDYTDHVIHQVENLSSSYLKILQIISYFKIEVTSNAICLADGEGSISASLIQMCKVPVFFNTLVDSNHLIAHRGTSYVPIECVNVSSLLRGSDLCAIYGGDLTDDSYVKEFLKIVPEEADIITFDAEKKGGFSWCTMKNMVKNVLRIAYKSHAKYLVFKIHLTSMMIVEHVVGMLNTLYRIIYVTVPVFSSHQNYEVYLVCHLFDPIVGSSEIGLCQTQMWRSTRNTLKCIQDNRLTDTPHFINNDIWKDLLKVGKRMGFNSSMGRNLERLCKYLISLDETINLIHIIDIQHTLIKYLKDAILAISQTHKTGIRSIEGKLLVHKYSSYHVTIDNLCQWILNYQLLIDMLEIPTIARTLNAIKSKRYTLLVSGVPNKNIVHVDITKNTSKNYVYKFDTYYHKLHPDIKKSLWAIWGTKYYPYMN